MMEIWYDAATMELKAVYSDTYSGTVWQTAGYLSLVTGERRVPRDFNPGAILDLSDPDPVVVTVAPPPEPDPQTLRLEELHAELAADTITPVRIREMLRLERGL